VYSLFRISSKYLKTSTVTKFPIYAHVVTSVVPAEAIEATNHWVSENSEGARRGVGGNKALPKAQELELWMEQGLAEGAGT
jgi:hypothetical protein